MRHRLIVLLSALLGIWLWSVQPASAQQSATQVLTVSSTAVGLSAATLTSNARQATACVFTVETDSIRLRYDGTNPTAAVGHLYEDSAAFQISTAAALRALRLIRVTTDATVTVTCSYGPASPALAAAGGSGGGGGGAAGEVSISQTGNENAVDVLTIAAGTNNIGDVDVLTMPVVAVTGTFWQATQPVSGTFWQATQPVSGTVTANAGSGTFTVGDGAGALNVICDSGCGGPASFLDNAAFTFGTTPVNVSGFVFDDVAPNAVTENAAAAPRMAANRVPYSTIRDAAGNERGANVTAANELLVELGAGAASIGILGANSGVDIGDVTLNNATIAVTQSGTWDEVGINDSGNSITVDGTVTVTDGAGAVNVIIDSGTTAVTNAGTFVTQENGAALTALQLIDNAISGAGFNITQFNGAAVPIGAGTAAAAIRVNESTDSQLSAGVGATADAIATAGDVGSLSAKMRRVTQQLSDVVGELQALDIATIGGIAPTADIVLDFDTVGTQNRSAVGLAFAASGGAVLAPGTVATGLLVDLAGAGLAALQLIDNVVGVEDVGETAAGGLSMAGSVRRDVAASSAGTTGDNATLNTDSLGLLWSRTFDPCSGTAKIFIPIDITTATTTELTPSLAGASTHYYICALNLVTNATNAVSLVDDNTDGCGSVTAALIGGLTAAEGWTFAANGGMTLGNGASSVMRTVTANAVLCLVTSAATQLSGHMVVVAAL